jgi:hypothetical protein
MITPEKTQSIKNSSPKCANPGCHCTVPPDGKYCSEHCENMRRMDTCDCGHAECETYTERKP